MSFQKDNWSAPEGVSELRAKVAELQQVSVRIVQKVDLIKTADWTEAQGSIKGPHGACQQNQVLNRLKAHSRKRQSWQKLIGTQKVTNCLRLIERACTLNCAQTNGRLTAPKEQRSLLAIKSALRKEKEVAADSQRYHDPEHYREVAAHWFN